MKILLFAVLINLSTLQAQVTGTVNVTPGNPAVAAVPTKVVSTAGVISCTLTGNAFPATGLIIACTINSSNFSYTLTLPYSTTYTFQHNYALDALTESVKSSSTGLISIAVGGIAANGVSNGTNITF